MVNQKVGKNPKKDVNINYLLNKNNDIYNSSEISI